MKKKIAYLLGSILAVVLSFLGAYIFISAFDCTKVTAMMLCMYSFIMAVISILCFDKYLQVSEENYRKNRF